MAVAQGGLQRILPPGVPVGQPVHGCLTPGTSTPACVRSSVQALKGLEGDPCSLRFPWLKMLRRRLQTLCSSDGAKILSASVWHKGRAGKEEEWEQRGSLHSSWSDLEEEAQQGLSSARAAGGWTGWPLMFLWF